MDSKIKWNPLAPLQERQKEMHQVFLQYTNYHTKDLIKEALKVNKNEIDLKKEGWEYLGCGDFKTAYRKGNIVLKFTNPYQVWKETRFYFTMVKYVRGHLARIYAYTDDRIVQEYIPPSPNTTCDIRIFEQFNRIKSKLNFCDVENLYKNASVRNGKVVIFDMDCENVETRFQKHVPSHIPAVGIINDTYL